MFANRGAFGSYRLLQSFDNKTLEAGRVLWHLSRRALAALEVTAALGARDAEPAIRLWGRVGRESS